jgi:hypothetical protein
MHGKASRKPLNLDLRSKRTLGNIIIRALLGTLDKIPATRNQRLLGYFAAESF